MTPDDRDRRWSEDRPKLGLTHVQLAVVYILETAPLDNAARKLIYAATGQATVVWPGKNHLVYLKLIHDSKISLTCATH